MKTICHLETISSTLSKSSFFPFLFLFFFFIVACHHSKKTSPDIYGKYKMFSNDPTIDRFVSGEDNYIQLNDDKTIIYNTTINQKPKYHINGTYATDEEPGILMIKWNEGRLPDKLKIEEQDGIQVIKIGQSMYKKQNRS